MDFAVAAMVLSTDGETVDDCPGHIFFALANPFTTGVVFVSDSIESAVFFVKAAVVQKLFAETSCEELSVFEAHFSYEFIRQCVCGLEGTVVGCEDVHGCFEQVD